MTMMMSLLVVVEEESVRVAVHPSCCTATANLVNPESISRVRARRHKQPLDHQDILLLPILNPFVITMSGSSLSSLNRIALWTSRLLLL
jgi:hypothetical protein